MLPYFPPRAPLPSELSDCFEIFFTKNDMQCGCCALEFRDSQARSTSSGAQSGVQQAAPLRQTRTGRDVNRAGQLLKEQGHQDDVVIMAIEQPPFPFYALMHEAELFVQGDGGTVRGIDI